MTPRDCQVGGGQRHTRPVPGCGRSCWSRSCWRRWHRPSSPSRRAQREWLRTGGPAAAHRTCVEPAKGLLAGASTIGVPATARWMTPVPAGRGTPRAGRAPGRTPHVDPAAMVRPVPSATLMVRKSLADVQVCRGAGGPGRGGRRWLFRAPSTGGLRAGRARRGPGDWRAAVSAGGHPRHRSGAVGAGYQARPVHRQQP
jgi:hypothetical protein